MIAASEIDSCPTPSNLVSELFWFGHAIHSI
jgi:hypothetical protein